MQFEIVTAAVGSGVVIVTENGAGKSLTTGTGGGDQVIRERGIRNGHLPAKLSMAPDEAMSTPKTRLPAKLEWVILSVPAMFSIAPP